MWRLSGGMWNYYLELPPPQFLNPQHCPETTPVMGQRVCETRRNAEAGPGQLPLPYPMLRRKRLSLTTAFALWLLWFVQKGNLSDGGWGGEVCVRILLG